MFADTVATLSKTYRVFLIDDHPLIRAGTAKVINMEPDLEVCGELGVGSGAVDALQQAKPDVVLLDLTLPDCNGLDVIKEYRAAGSTEPILVLSMHEESLYAERALRAGANGYLMKDEATFRLIEGIRTVLGGEVFLSDTMSRLMLKRMAGSGQPGAVVQRLTAREFEVLELIGKGQPSRAIAARLGISPKTVDAHRAHIKEKLGLREGTELVRFAVRWVDTGEGNGATGI